MIITLGRPARASNLLREYLEILLISNNIAFPYD